MYIEATEDALPKCICNAVPMQFDVYRFVELFPNIEGCDHNDRDRKVFCHDLPFLKVKSVVFDHDYLSFASFVLHEQSHYIARFVCSPCLF